VAGLTLDSGALIAAERGDRRFWAFWKEAIAADTDITVPAPVLVESWRGARNARMAMVLSGCIVEALGERLAKTAGLLSGKASTSDVTDAVVALSAALRGDTILTVDARDINRLVGLLGRRGRVVSLDQL
jgi:predicted nucleic acid-binding protein